MFERQLTERLQQHRAAHLYRVRRELTASQLPEVIYAGKRCVSFCSSDYLGLAQHPEVLAAFKQAASEYGVSAGASALVSGYTKIHKALEEELAAFTQRPKALLFSTGYMANVGIVTALLQAGDTILADRLNHASLMDAARFSGAQLRRYLHHDIKSLQKLLLHATAENRLIITDGVFSVDGDIAPLAEISALAKQYQTWLMVDDAHGFGVIGEDGSGSVLQAKLTAVDVPILVGTLSKAFGTFGGFVTGSEILIEALVQFARSYIYTHALPTAIAAATRVSLHLLQTEYWRRNHLAEIIHYFKAGAVERGLTIMVSTTPIQLVLLHSAAQAVACGAQLAEHGLLVGVMRPPTVPPNTARLRITLTALHTKQHIDHLLDTLSKIVVIEKNYAQNALS